MKNIEEMSMVELIEARNNLDAEIGRREAEENIIRLRYEEMGSCYIYAKNGTKYGVLEESEHFSSNGYQYLKLCKRDDDFYVFVGRNTNFQGSRDTFNIALKTKHFSKAIDMFNSFKNDIDELLYRVS